MHEVDDGRDHRAVDDSVADNLADVEQPRIAAPFEVTAQLVTIS